MYRLCYDSHFLPNSLEDGFIYKDKRIIGLSLYFIYKAIDKKTGKERFFDGETKEDQTFPNPGNNLCPFGFFIDDFYSCHIDKEHGYMMLPNKELLEKSDYEIFYEPECEACYWENNATPIIISFEEAVEILKNNFGEFDNSNNRPTQSLSYSVHEICE